MFILNKHHTDGTESKTNYPIREVSYFSSVAELNIDVAASLFS